MIGPANVSHRTLTDSGRWCVGTFRHPVCGSGEIQTEAWADLNRDTLVDYAEGGDYYCEECGEPFDHRNVCHVLPDGTCEYHDQPFEVCRAEWRDEVPA